MNKEKVYVSVIIYTCNDARYIEDFLLRLDEVFSRDFQNYDFTIVDDASTDDTTQKIKEAGKHISGGLSVIKLAWKHGIELAMLAATDSVIGDFILEIEQAEFFYPEDIFIRMYKTATENGFDVVTASGIRTPKLTSRLFYRVLNRFSPLNLELQTEDLRIITRRVINRITNDKNKVRYRKILYKYSGFKYYNIKYQEINKPLRQGRTGQDRIKNGLETLIMFTNLGTKLGVLLSSGFFMLSFALGIYTIFTYLINKNVASGWTTLMLFLSLGFSGMFFVLTILAQYMAIILLEVQQSRIYTVTSIDRISYED